MPKTSPMWRLRVFLLSKFASVPDSLLKYVDASTFVRKLAKISKTMISTMEEEREKKSEANVVKAAAEGKCWGCFLVSVCVCADDCDSFHFFLFLFFFISFFFTCIFIFFLFVASGCAACVHCLWSLAYDGARVFGAEDEMLYRDDGGIGSMGGGEEIREELAGSELLRSMLSEALFDETLMHVVLGMFLHMIVLSTIKPPSNYFVLL